MSRSQGQRIQVPDDLREVLLEFTISYLLEQPGDVINYAADYFARLRDTRHTEIGFDKPRVVAATPSSPEESISREEGESVQHGVATGAATKAAPPFFEAASREGSLIYVEA